MIFLAPFVLLGLAALPGLIFLLRLRPPAARRVVFPPIFLLQGLPRPEARPRQMALPLLLLRLAVAGLIVLGLASPSLHPPAALPGSGPVLLVIDNGWAAAAAWPQMRLAAARILGAAEHQHRAVALLATARDAGGAAPAILPAMPAALARQTLDALMPQPWPVDRAGAIAALAGAAPAGALPATRIYLADGITDGGDFPAFLRALRPARIIAPEPPPPLLLPPGFDSAGRLVGRVASPTPGLVLLAGEATGGSLAEARLGSTGEAAIDLPAALGRRIGRLALLGPPSAGSVFLLDHAGCCGPVGLASGSAAAQTPFLGALYFLSRALPAGSRALTSDFTALLAEKPDVIVLADVVLTPAQLRRANAFLAGGGEIIRFAGPLTAAAPDGLAPDALLPGDRRLGGALTWTSPQPLAAFPAGSPLAGIDAGGAQVAQQILADPTRLDPGTVWARLADGTPLILGRAMGRGLLVSVLTTANADWSDLPLDGVYPAMLGRLIGLAGGAAIPPGRVLPMLSALNGFGDLVAPPAAAAGISLRNLREAAVSAAIPPGLYGDGATVFALNLGGHIAPPEAARLPGAEKPGIAPAPADFGGLLLAGAVLLLCLDLLISLRLRGLLRLPRPGQAVPGGFIGLIALIALAPPSARAQAAPPAALQTELAYLLTGDAATDRLSADALQYLSSLVSSRSSAQLGSPAGVAADAELGLYPLLYWPILASAPAPSPAACAALNLYMQHGGLLLLDTQGGDAAATGSGAGFAPGAAAALRRATACLNLPPLEKLDPASVIARSFYRIDAFPGKFTGPVLIASGAARDADGVSPVLIGGNDWAGAWARDANGDPEQTPLPDGEDQRVTADRFGVNLVLYALTGSYKADQAALPALLETLGGEAR